MTLTDVELRVLGALIEKDRTTPENYPLSTQGLVTACNQRTSRDPVTDLHLQDVLAAVGRLKDRGLVETVQEPGDRVPKHRHKAMAAFGLNARELALLAVLMLRGPQTPGELRSRTERYTSFPDVPTVEATLQGLAARPAPLANNLGRAAGQSQDRWMHALGADEGKMAPRVRIPRDSHGADRPGDFGRAANGSGTTQGPVSGVAEARAADGEEDSGSYAELLRRLERLERRVELLEEGS